MFVAIIREPAMYQMAHTFVIDTDDAGIAATKAHEIIKASGRADELSITEVQRVERVISGEVTK